MRTIIVLSLSLAICAGETSNIHGTILDPSGWPVEGARIACGNLTVYSNTEGRFTVAGVDKCAARIERIGFEPQTAELAVQTESRITLVVAGPVETVVVSATRTETTPEQAAVAANVITEQQLVARDFPMVFDVLRDLPGLQVIQSGRPGSIVSLFTRGSNSTQTLVLLDGVPLNEPGGQVNLAHLTSEGVERIEVVRGPESALFGAEASAGVIQLFTKRGDPEETVPHGSVSYERGNFQTDRWIANLNGGYRNRLDYSLSAAELHTAGEYPNDYYRDNTGSANVGFRISESTEARAVFRIYDAHVGTPGAVAFHGPDLVSNEETRDSTLSLRLDDSRGANYLQRFTFGYTHLSDRFNSSFPSLNVPQRKTAGYQGTLSHRGGALVFGYDYQDQSGDLSGINASRNNNGFFANLQQNVGRRIYLSGGARVEHSSAFGTIGSGRGGASLLLLGEHGVLSSTIFRVSAGRGVTEPSLLQNFARATFYHGNPALQPEKTNTYEAALVSEWFGRRVRTEIAGFRSSFTNLIAFVSDTWQNVQASWARGVETSAQARLAKSIFIQASYMRLYTRITSSAAAPSSPTGIGQPLLRRPGNSGAVSITVTPRRWSLTMGGRFMGERNDIDNSFQVARNPNYENFYASASYDVTRHVTPVLRLDNLLNESYQEALGYPALSRSIIGGVRIHW
jgi:outer membrane cobalamin receptor